MSAESRDRAREPVKAPVMADVARLAGVSHQTVSRVVNRQSNLRPATRERVEEAIQQLGYRPNTVARALVTRRSGTIGVIGTKSGFWGPASVHRSVQAAAREAGFFVSSVNLQSVTREDFAGAVAHLRAQPVEGIILIAAQDEALEVARAQEIGDFPLVVVEGDLAQARRTVGVDQVKGAVQAVRHLVDLGHREIAHVAGPQDWTEGKARLRGYREEMSRAGLRASRPYSGDWTPESGYRAGLRLVERPGVTGVFVANDHMAIGLLRALHEAGVAVPGEVSVVGFDDLPESAYLIPPLTTVRQDFTAVGRRAIEVLGSAIGEVGSATEPGAEGLHLLIDPELVVRASTGPARERSS